MPKCSFFYALIFWIHSGSETVFAEFPIESQSKKKICSCSCLVLALQTFASHYVPKHCSTPTTVTKKKNVYTVLTSIDTQGSKVFRPVQKGYLALWIGFKYFYYLSDDTNAVSVMHADEITKWSKQVLTVLWDVFCDLSLCMDSHKNRLLVKGVSVPYHCGQINQ